jgi:hypothetical protein
MFVISVLGTPGVAASAIVRRFKTFALIPGTRRTGLRHRAGRRGRRLRHLGRHRRQLVPQGSDPRILVWSGRWITIGHKHLPTAHIEEGELVTAAGSFRSATATGTVP